jgi:hypothetical protein
VALSISVPAHQSVGYITSAPYLVAPL